MRDVMERVRDELGPDAIIVKTDQGKKFGGIRVTAAVEAGAEVPSHMDDNFSLARSERPELVP